MSIVLDSIAEELAKLSRLVPVPEGELGYGLDLSCVTDLTEDLAEVDPNSFQGIGEASLRRLITPRGDLPDDPDYGLGVAAWCNRATRRQDLLSCQAEVRNELVKDDRISDVTATVTYQNRVLSIHAEIEPKNPSIGPFSLTLAVSEGGEIQHEVRR